MFFFFPPETPDHPSLFSRTVIGRGTFPALAPVLGPEQKKLAMSLFCTVHGGQYDIEYVTSEQLSYCMRHSWRTKLGAIILNQVVGF